MIPPIIDALEKISNTSSELKLQYIGVAYKPVSTGDDSLTRSLVTWGKKSPLTAVCPLTQFLSLFNLTQAGIDGMVDYASALAIEVRNNSNVMTVSMNL